MDIYDTCVCLLKEKQATSLKDIINLHMSTIRLNLLNMQKLATILKH